MGKFSKIVSVIAFVMTLFTVVAWFFDESQPLSKWFFFGLFLLLMNAFYVRVLSRPPQVSSGKSFNLSESLKTVNYPLLISSSVVFSISFSYEMFADDLANIAKLIYQFSFSR